MKNAAILILAVLCLALAGCQSDSLPPASVGTIEAHADTIKRIADQSKAKAASPEDATAFGLISDEATAIQTGIAALEKTVGDLQKRLKSATDNAKLRDSLIWLAPSGLILCVAGFAAWGYFKFRWLEYIGVAGAGIAVGAIVLYLSIQSIQMAMPWVLLGIGVLCVGGVVYWIIQNRKATVTQLVASTNKALTLPVKQAIDAIDALQSPATKAIVAQVQAANPDLATPAVA